MGDETAAEYLNLQVHFYVRIREWNFTPTSVGSVAIPT
jgi:hypothetical protein